MKRFLTATLLTLALCSSGCIGPNKAFDGLKEWNEGLSEKDWVVETVFLSATIVPVYSFAYLLDIVFLNTIDYWSKDGEAAAAE